MPRIFISYRRADTQSITDRIYDYLADIFGKQNVFQDVFDIDYGADFREVLQKQVQACDVLLVVIGSQWLSIKNTEGERRLDQENDSVRIEVETGLKNPSTRVIPVLVDGAKLPLESELPESLRELRFRNGVEVRYNPYFDDDMKRLEQQLRRYTPRMLIVGIGAAILILTVIVAALVIPSLSNGDGMQTLTSSAATQVASGAGQNQNETTPLISTQIMIIDSAFSLFQNADESSMIIARVSAGTQVTLAESSVDGWTRVVLEDGRSGWAHTVTIRGRTATPPAGITPISVSGGYGARSDHGWQVFFTEPLVSESSPPRDCSDPASLAVTGIASRLAEAIDRAESTLDIAAYEFDHCLLTQAVLDAHARQVVVRIVMDVDTSEDLDSSFEAFNQAGIPVVTDERSALMHNKFMIIDGSTVWTGSWNFTYNDTYRNINNTLVFSEPITVSAYQTEFNEMFEDHSFGPQSAVTTGSGFSEGGVTMRALFAPEDDVANVLLQTVSSAQRTVHFMAFSFTYDALGDLMLNQVELGIPVRGIFETTGSETQFGELTKLYCARVPVFQDGYPHIMHHKVIIIDGEIVITGSFNFSSSAIESNDENLIIIRDPDLAAEYLAEFDRQQAVAVIPTGIECT
jgi:phosphatidylserine/phosphatidylglycerophosphate/cardiolipin synthase-like enzyme